MTDEEKAYQMMKDFAEQNPAVRSLYKTKDNNSYIVFTAPPKVMFGNLALENSLKMLSINIKKETGYDCSFVCFLSSLKAPNEDSLEAKVWEKD